MEVFEILSICQVHCHKLSPNLRKQSKEVKIALLSKDTRKAAEFEVNKLEVLLAQVVRRPDSEIFPTHLRCGTTRKADLLERKYFELINLILSMLENIMVLHIPV